MQALCWLVSWGSDGCMSCRSKVFTVGTIIHSLSAIQLSAHNVFLVAFGGQRSLYSADKLSELSSLN